MLLAALMGAPESVEGLPVDRTLFLPGSTTDGHYQIELACESCHVEAFADRSQMQGACVECHGGELARVDDSHPRSKFTDPRNADRVAVLDARECITCHQEHRPEITSSMGLSLPTDYCYRCHEDIGEDRPTHADLAFDSCSNVGCHNFHDNRALYEDFLVEHRGEPEMRPVAQVAWRERDRAVHEARRDPLGAADHDAPSDLPELGRWVGEWAGTSHAQAGTQCSDCHIDESGVWSNAVAVSQCGSCHELEEAGFLGGRHGMRIDAGFAPMRPAMARLPMHADSGDEVLDCNACHGAHDYDTQHAAADACLACHADEHSRAWEDSSHATAWRAEIAGESEAGTGVSCATCHLPRMAHPGDPKRSIVGHNQNDFLRPRDKMIRSSCLQCHGLAFALDSLADPALVTTNFRGRPTRKVESIHFAAVLRWQLEGRTPPWGDTKEIEKE